jgi:ABC-type Mn2+/Zn2+ transport system permease subunit
MILSSLSGIWVLTGIYASFVLNLLKVATIIMVNFIFFNTAFLLRHNMQHSYRK